MLAARRYQRARCHVLLLINFDRYNVLSRYHTGNQADYLQVVDDCGVTHPDAWVGYYDLELYSNFTYFLNDPVNGDQFEQTEERLYAGVNLWRYVLHACFGIVCTVPHSRDLLHLSSMSSLGESLCARIVAGGLVSLLGTEVPFTPSPLITV